MTLNPAHPLGPEFLAEVQARLDCFFDAQDLFLNFRRDSFSDAGHCVDLMWDQARQCASGGKRIRPGFCYWTYVGVSGETELDPGVMDIAASLDLLHAFALVHDDLIDGSDFRRGNPSTHRFFGEVHSQQEWLGDGGHFGTSSAILVGDLLFAWSVSMVEQAKIAPEKLSRARPFLEAVRTEVLAGQFLDLVIEAKPLDPSTMIEDATMVMEFKTSKYTVTRPMLIGAGLAGASQATIEALNSFGFSIGRAFQMRDDLLGIFGDSAVMGKPSGDDIRSGKKTVVIGEALRKASSEDGSRLIQMLGDPSLTESDIDQARTILVECGAVESTETMIRENAVAGCRYLEDLPLSAEGRQALMGLVQASVERDA
ncbi:MAG: polyprenyl synthetase family protein [Propionibacteriaceae bacterium]|jgi:geranylgeranyl diphosphate synthase type I|nr:polyprenyl synthetase family protein [Propionibacteriaceae bacterium]